MKRLLSACLAIAVVAVGVAVEGCRRNAQGDKAIVEQKADHRRFTLAEFRSAIEEFYKENPLAQESDMVKKSRDQLKLVEPETIPETGDLVWAGWSADPRTGEVSMQLVVPDPKRPGRGGWCYWPFQYLNAQMKRDRRGCHLVEARDIYIDY